MQAVPDYTSQLNQIAQGLNRPSTPTWLIPIVSLVIGALLTLAVQFLLKWEDTQVAERRLRKLIYRDIGQKALFVYATINEMHTNPELYEYFAKELKNRLTPDTENHLKAKLDLYMDLREYSVADHLYQEFRSLIEKRFERNVTAGRIIWLIGHYLEGGALQKNLFLRYMSKNAGTRIVELSTRTYLDGKEILKRVNNQGTSINEPSVDDGQESK